MPDAKRRTASVKDVPFLQWEGVRAPAAAPPALGPREPPPGAFHFPDRSSTMTRPVTPTTLPAEAVDFLVQPWSGPFGGVPPFDRVRVEDLLPALDAAIAEALDEIGRIVSDPAPPTFENTVVPLERAGGALERVRAIVNVWRTTMSGPELQAVEGEIMVRLSEYGDRVVQDRELFRRIEAVYSVSESVGLAPEEARLTWLHHRDFVRSGAALDDGAKARLAEINRSIAELSTRFDQNVMSDEAEHFVRVESAEELAGLPAAERAAAAEAARLRGVEGWVIANTRSAVEPFLVHADDRDLRERVWRTFVSRGDSPGARSNRPVIAEILRLRLERARLLGYPTHAHWAVEKTMARTPARALELVRSVWAAAVERVRVEVEEMQDFARSLGHGEIEIRPWDYRYYAEKVRERTCRLEADAVQPYLQLERLREAMFWVAGELFDLDFVPADVPVYHPDVRAWEVRRRGEREHVGLFYLDPFAREGKRSGAWMNHYRIQHGLDGGASPVVSNNCNYSRAQPGEPVLLGWTDARTLFHEFGHALHGLLSDVTYPSLAGTQVTADYVEFPSQLLEHWLSTPELLRRFAVHYRTGEPIPDELVERLACVGRSGEGFATTEALASALVDMQLHLETGDIDPIEVERVTLEEHGLPAEVAPRHLAPHFGHIFSSGYAAGYFSYLWADVLAADAWEAFVEAGGAYDGDVAERLRSRVLSRGNVLDPEEGYRSFRRRDPLPEALMRSRGFASASA